ncbi:MAG: hypothetical protein FJZ00_02740 [Candidatus Sericytochromatia bacterium]|uniref:Uncharacterized protein n=1 Tax=Candidatus Tanganyikabacteria bacterium TaxID=2961651 RepID=A0A937X148_9BACT|nr:hypothetical protein [Candidatus Tanganyikabacteria bacterium]
MGFIDSLKSAVGSVVRKIGSVFDKPDPPEPKLHMAPDRNDVSPTCGNPNPQSELPLPAPQKQSTTSNGVYRYISEEGKKQAWIEAKKQYGDDVPAPPAGQYNSLAWDNKLKAWDTSNIDFISNGRQISPGSNPGRNGDFQISQNGGGRSGRGSGTAPPTQWA